ncbi:MAG: DUF3300 domain-containing protein, partial [Acidobacteria bacterium ACB2]|nr:DUF3300 domain-containing protein [Acidobacteria bacterium ACB2]
MTSRNAFPVRRLAGRPSGLLAIVCACLLVPGEGVLLAQAAPAAPAAKAAAAPEAEAKLSPDQLDSLVAPIALYPDDLLAQVLAASTYPLEIIQLQQWLAKNPNLKDKALADAVAKQPWDPAVQSMAAFPDAVKRLAEDIQWTTDLGNAFLAQQADVMAACQRMRKKAKEKGTLSSSEQMKVETKVVEKTEVIVIQSANPEVIYVPSYNPTVVYPPPVYAYPPIYYPPPPPPGAMFFSFSMGVMIGAAWGGSCCHCGWGHNDINININNSFNQINANRNTNVSGNRGGGNSWQHNSQHRGGAPYSNQATASKYGGSTRPTGASQQARGGSGSPSAGQQARGGASASQQGRGRASAGQQDRSGGASASQQGRGSSGGSRAGAMDRSGGSGS